MTEYRFDVWEMKGRGRETTGWSRVRWDLSWALAEQYEQDCPNPVHVEISRDCLHELSQSG